PHVPDGHQLRHHARHRAGLAGAYAHAEPERSGRRFRGAARLPDEPRASPPPPCRFRRHAPGMVLHALHGWHQPALHLGRNSRDAAQPVPVPRGLTRSYHSRMSFFAILFAFLIEQVRPLARHNPIHALLRGWARWTSTNFDAGKPQHGWVTWGLAVLVPAVAVSAIHWLLIAFVGWPFALVWSVAVLYITLGFRQFSHHFTAIRDALDGGDEQRARRRSDPARRCRKPRRKPGASSTGCPRAPRRWRSPWSAASRTRSTAGATTRSASPTTTTASSWPPLPVL